MQRNLPGAVKSRANPWKMGSLLEVYLLNFLLTQIENIEIRREKNECRCQQCRQHCMQAACAVVGKSQSAERAGSSGTRVRGQAGPRLSRPWIAKRGGSSFSLQAVQVQKQCLSRIWQNRNSLMGGWLWPWSQRSHPKEATARWWSSPRIFMSVAIITVGMSTLWETLRSMESQSSFYRRGNWGPEKVHVFLEIIIKHVVAKT